MAVWLQYVPLSVQAAQPCNLASDDTRPSALLLEYFRHGGMLGHMADAAGAPLGAGDL
jgi:hypothetical protein